MKNYEKRRNVNFAQIATEDIDDEWLDGIKTKFMEDIDWSDGLKNRALIVNNLLVDPNIYTEINSDEMSDHEPRDSSSEEYRSVEETDQSDNYLYDETAEDQERY